MRFPQVCVLKLVVDVLLQVFCFCRFKSLWYIDSMSSNNCCRQSLAIKLVKSVSCRFCHADVTLLENVSARSGLGSSWIVSCQNEHCPSRKTNAAFNTTTRGKGLKSIERLFLASEQWDEDMLVHLRRLASSYSVNL